MKLSDFDLLPGVVQTAEDPEHKGRIKCTVPGIFDPNTMPDATLPWVYPLCMTRYQSFSKLMKGSKVWVLNNTKNKFEYWYIPMFDFHTPLTKTFVSDNYSNDPEVVFLRDNGCGTGAYTYDDQEGHKLTVNDDYIQLKKGNVFEVKANEGKVKIDGSLVYTGNDKDTYEPAVLGNTLVDLLTKLSAAVGELQSSASESIFTSHMAAPCIQIKEVLGKANTILAKNTLLN